MIPMRCTRALATLGLLALLMGGCSNQVRRPPAATSAVAVPARGPVGAPTFQKVPPEENTALVEPPPADASQPPAKYTIEVEDILDVSVYGETELQHVEIPVRPDGMISFAFIGDVPAAGRTVEEVRQEVTQRLGQYLRTPQVTVIAKGFAQKKVYVGGEVRSPGVLMLGGREGTLLDALYKAGLVTQKADLEGAYIMRSNRVVAADFKGLVRGDMTRNVPLRDNDLVYVPENIRRYVYILGEVRRNDALEIGEPIPIIEAIARAGGFNQYAKKREIAIIRGGLKQPEVAIIDAKRLIEGDMSQNILVQPGDIVYVSISALGKYNSFIDQVLKTISPLVQGIIVSNTVNP